MKNYYRNRQHRMVKTKEDFRQELKSLSKIQAGRIPEDTFLLVYLNKQAMLRKAGSSVHCCGNKEKKKRSTKSTFFAKKKTQSVRVGEDAEMTEETDEGRLQGDSVFGDDLSVLVKKMILQGP